MDVPGNRDTSPREAFEVTVEGLVGLVAGNSADNLESIVAWAMGPQFEAAYHWGVAPPTEPGPAGRPLDVVVLDADALRSVVLDAVAFRCEDLDALRARTGRPPSRSSSRVVALVRRGRDAIEARRGVVSVAARPGVSVEKIERYTSRVCRAYRDHRARVKSAWADDAGEPEPPMNSRSQTAPVAVKVGLGSRLHSREARPRPESG